MDHDKVTESIGGKENYGKGIFPNPYADQQKEWFRRKLHYPSIHKISAKIESLFEPRFITPPETAELIAAIVTATGALKVLEIGTCTGFTTLHILRALIGKPGAQIVSVDSRPAHDRKFWAEFKYILEFLEGWTPDILTTLSGMVFDLVFIDSDHSVEHTEKELKALWPITRKGTLFLVHDLPEWHTPTDRSPVPVRTFLMDKVKSGFFDGAIVPTCEQLDCLDAYGPGYPSQCNPHLGVFVRL